MSGEANDEQDNILQKHAQLLADLPRSIGCLGAELHQYLGIWLHRNPLLGAMLMQTHSNHFKPTDIFLSSFLKCGTTWLRSRMFTILNRSRFDFSDHPLLRKGPHECFPVLDIYKPEDYSLVSDMEALPSPRLFATHIAYKLFPSSITDPSSGCKLVYVCREPKDVLVSLWHFMFKVRAKELPPLSFDQVFQMFCKGAIDYGPYWNHVLGYWEASVKSPDKILFLKYEEMKREPEVYVKRLAEFMGVPISTQEEENGMVKKIAEFCSFEHLTSLEINKIGTYKTNSGVVIQNQAYFRRSEVEDWKCHLTDEMKDQIDRITNEKLRGSGLTLDTTLK